MSSKPTYWDYLQLDKLLTLQGGLEDDESELLPDELHFIIVHQSYELWFKLMLRSLRLARDHLAQRHVAEEAVPHVVHHLRRVTAILKLGVQQFEVVETLTSQDFLAFRDKLTPSSGFQSFQMRELEIVVGLEDAQRLHYGGVNPLDHIRKLAAGSPGGAMAWARIEGARKERTMLSVLNDWLYRTPIQGSVPGDPEDALVVSRFLDEYLERLDAMLDGNEARLAEALGLGDRDALRERFGSVRAAARAFLFAEDISEGDPAVVRRVRAAVLFIESYRRLPLLAWPRLLLDQIVEMEEQFVIWRHRHARMVERLIGRRVGTGGSGGVDYLDQTGAYRTFRDLWAVRTVLLPEAVLPPLLHGERYSFASR